MDRLTITRHCHSKVHIELQLCCEFWIRSEPELVARVHVVIELNVQQQQDQQERNDWNWI